MMVIIILSKCPPSLRGDLSKWLFEVSANVFVGKLTVRVKDELWDRISNSISEGKATMIFSERNEQHFDCNTYNSDYVPMDFDGIKLMMKPSGGRLEKKIEPN